jgi:DNA-binding transcriptional LysR family regulator
MFSVRSMKLSDGWLCWRPINLRSFLSVIVFGSFTKAAERVHRV